MLNPTRAVSNHELSHAVPQDELKVKQDEEEFKATVRMFEQRMQVCSAPSSCSLAWPHCCFLNSARCVLCAQESVSIGARVQQQSADVAALYKQCQAEREEAQMLRDVSLHLCLVSPSSCCFTLWICAMQEAARLHEAAERMAKENEAKEVSLQKVGTRFSVNAVQQHMAKGVLILAAIKFRPARCSIPRA